MADALGVLMLEIERGRLCLHESGTYVKAREVDPILWTIGSGFLSGTAAVRSSQ